MLRRGLEELPKQYRKAAATFLKKIQERFDEELIAVVVFGSVARETFTSASDLDILVVVETLPERLIARTKLFTDITFDIGVTLNVTINVLPYDLEEALQTQVIFLDMSQEGILLFDRDQVMEQHLMHINNTLNTLGARRIAYKRGHYWVLKPNIKPGEIINL